MAKLKTNTVNAFQPKVKKGKSKRKKKVNKHEKTNMKPYVGQGSRR